MDWGVDFFHAPMSFEGTRIRVLQEPLLVGFAGAVLPAAIARASSLPAGSLTLFLCETKTPEFWLEIWL